MNEPKLSPHQKHKQWRAGKGAEIIRKINEERVDNDLVLVEKAKKGDAQAKQELCSKHYQRVYQHIYAILEKHGNEEIVGDLTQDTFLRAMSKLDQFKGEALFTTWLTSIAINSARSWLRRYNRQHSIELVEEKMEPTESTPNVLTALVENYDRSLVQRAIESLSEKEQQLIYFFYGEGYSIAEISQETGTAEQNIRTALFRTRKKLKEALANLDE